MRYIGSALGGRGGSGRVRDWVGRRMGHRLRVQMFCGPRGEPSSPEVASPVPPARLVVAPAGSANSLPTGDELAQPHRIRPLTLSWRRRSPERTALDWMASASHRRSDMSTPDSDRPCCCVRLATGNPPHRLLAREGASQLCVQPSGSSAARPSTQRSGARPSVGLACVSPVPRCRRRSMLPRPTASVRLLLCTLHALSCTLRPLPLRQHSRPSSCLLPWRVDRTCSWVGHPPFGRLPRPRAPPHGERDTPTPPRPALGSCRREPFGRAHAVPSGRWVEHWLSPNLGSRAPHVLAMEAVEHANRGGSDDAERHAGFGRRMLAKVKAVWSRRRKSGVGRVGEGTPMVEEPTTGAVGRESSAIGPSGMDIETDEPQARAINGDLQSTTPPHVHDAHVSAVDEEVEDSKPRSAGGDSAEQLLPMRPSRSGLTNDKARALFEKHGVKYEPVSSRSRTSRNTPLRVEKPIRIRVHWTCHACTTQFGGSQVCEECGHARCGDCYKTPPRRVKEVLDSALSEREGDMTTQREAASPESRSQPVTHLSQLQPLEARTPNDTHSSSDDDDDQPRESYLLVLQQTTTSAHHLTSHPNTHRTCHQCRTPLALPTPPQCTHCNHAICSLCPREPTRRDQWAYGPEGRALSGHHPKPIATVERVYRKPRQRIRWTCHECQTMFVDKKDCKACGHARCRDCPRTP